MASVDHSLTNTDLTAQLRAARNDVEALFQFTCDLMTDYHAKVKQHKLTCDQSLL